MWGFSIIIGLDQRKFNFGWNFALSTNSSANSMNFEGVQMVILRIWNSLIVYRKPHFHVDASFVFQQHYGLERPPQKCNGYGVEKGELHVYSRSKLIFFKNVFELMGAQMLVSRPWGKNSKNIGSLLIYY